MSGFTEEQVEEMIREAVSKTEKSFGSTFKRLKAENEELQTMRNTAAQDFESSKTVFEKRIAALEQEVNTGRNRISELAIDGEIQRQLRETGPLPEEFLDVRSIEYSDDPGELKTRVADAIGRGRSSLARVLDNMGITPSTEPQPGGNPTNPPTRDTKTARDLRQSGSQEVLRDMVRRGLLR
jgi:hypothetical protein